MSVTHGEQHPANTPGFWEDAYREERDAWDMGTPTPVFVDLLTAWGSRIDRLVSGNSPDELSNPGRALEVLVPCSGRGHDAILFAQNGYRVTAVDFAVQAADHLRREAERSGVDLEVLSEDMFALGSSRPGRYDLLLEYTCLCAIDPMRRTEYIDLCADVLRPGGLFLGLIFPVDGRAGGPPWSIDPAEFSANMDSRFTLRIDEVPGKSVKPRQGKERLMIWERRSDA